MIFRGLVLLVMAKYYNNNSRARESVCAVLFLCGMEQFGWGTMTRSLSTLGGGARRREREIQYNELTKIIITRQTGHVQQSVL